MTMPTPPAPADPATGTTPPAPIPTPLPAPAVPPVPQPVAGQVPVAPAVPQWNTPPVMPQMPAAPAPEDERDFSRLPKWAQDEVTKLRNENASRRVSERSAIVAQHAYINATALGVNGHALLGSTAFAAVAAQLDPKAPDFQAQLTAKVGEILAANPWMAAQSAAPPAIPPTPPAPVRSGVDFSGGTGAPPAITEDQLAQMSQADIAKAFAEGKLKHLM